MSTVTPEAIPVSAGLFALRGDTLSILQAVQTLSLLAVAFFTLRAPVDPWGPTP